MKYNLAEIPATGIYKVNQYGEPVEGARFAVYAANEKYEYLSSSHGGAVSLQGEYKYDRNGNMIDDSGNIVARALYVGTTDESGEMVFRDNDDMPYTLNELKDMFGEYFILRETQVPEGYRLVSDEIKLCIQNHVLLCKNTYESGVWASPTLLTTAPGTLKKVNGDTVDYFSLEDNDSLYVNGTLFAVVLKYFGEGEDELKYERSWMPIYGSDEEGYNIVDTAGGFIKAVIEAAQGAKSGEGVFDISASGAMQVNLTNLPGDITTYYYMLDPEEKGDTKYTVAYYWTDGNLDDATVDNTYRIDADVDGYAFSRAFGASIRVPNLTNRLYAQKLDEDGNLINGAVFALYQVEEVSDTIYYTAADGTRICLEPDSDGDNEGTARIDGETVDYRYKINPRSGYITVSGGTREYLIKPYQIKEALAASDSENKSGEDGTATFAAMEDGTYYLREISAPDGYRLNTAETMVLVEEDAVYANAGTLEDDVDVGRGPGYLVATLNGFASEGDVDNTLTWIYEMMRVSEVSRSFSAYKDKKWKSWGYLTENYGAGLAQSAADGLKTHLKYEPDGEKTLFNYTVNREWYGDDADSVARRLYTPVGWSYYEIYQDQEAKEKSGSSANYTELVDENGDVLEIANLFSRSVYVRVKDKRRVVTIQKVDMANSSNVLSGAGFVIYYEDADGTKHYLDMAGGSDNISWKPFSDGEDEKTYEIFTDVSGRIIICNLPDGIYYLKETSAPAGYYPITTKMPLTIKGGIIADKESGTTGVKVLEDGLVLLVPNSSYALPSTGGSGTLWYMFSGLSLMAGTLMYMIYKRRRREDIY